RRRVQRISLAPGARCIENAVRDERRRLLAAIRIELVEPRRREPDQGVLVDLRQRRVALLEVRAAVREPVLRLARRVLQALLGDGTREIRRWSGGLVIGAASGEHG